MKILVGEDDQAIAEVVTIILTNAGYEVTHVESEEALLMHLAKKPQLVLLDIALGGGDGGKITRTLKKDANYSSIPVVMMSANSDTEKIAKKSGADGFILKPFDMDDLLKIVASYSSVPLS